MSGALKTIGPAELRRFGPYPAYKDSGVEWLGQIPAHWELKRLKSIASVQLSNVDKKTVEGEEPVRLCNYVDVYYNERIPADLDFMTATATPEQIRRFSLRACDVLITKDSESWTDIAVPAVVAEDLPGVLCGYHLAHIRPGAGCHGPFLARAFSAIGPRDQFQISANGITRFGLGGDAIRTGLFAVPPESEQRAIALFLDRETAKIDALVAKKEQLLELLQEKRAALITRAVTRGLDPRVPMKDSGIEWLGEIPLHWKVMKYSRYFRSSMGQTILKEDLVDDGDVTVFSATESGTTFGRINNPSVLLDAGDIVIPARGVSIGHALLVTEPATCTQTTIYSKLMDRSQIFPRYVLYFMLGYRRVLFYYDRTAIPQITVEQVSANPLLVPPPDEQRAIAEFLDRETARINRLIVIVGDAIGRLKELRNALISAAVTGKIDVRGEAP